MIAGADPRVVVVAYNNTDDLTACLAALGSALPIVVVDNGGDDAVEQLCSRLGADYVRSPGNVGFAAAVNQGIGFAAPGQDVLLVNPDAQVSAADVRRLVAHLHADDRLAAVSPSLREPAGSARVQWPIPSPREAWVEALGLRKWIKGRQHFVIGAVLLLRSEALRTLGGFDERYFLYAEETDWQLRAIRAGWRVAVAPGIEALHLGSGSSSDEGRRSLLFHRGVEIFVRKWYGDWGWHCFRIAVLVGAALRAAAGAGLRMEHLRRLKMYAIGPVRAAGRVHAP